MNYVSTFSIRHRRRVTRVFNTLGSWPIYRRIYYRRIKEGLKSLEIEGCNVCNLKCVMCPYERMTRPKTLMEMPLFQKIVNDAVAGGIMNVTLNFYNEPLADPLILERIKYARSKGMHTELFTNGTLLKEKLNAVIESGIDSIVVSLDAATQETYKKIRGADFNNTVAGILGLVGKIPVTVSFVVQNGNHHEIEAFRSFWKGNAETHVCGADNRRDDTQGCFKRLECNKLYPCTRMFRTMNIMSNGQVALCCMDYDGSTILGNLNSESIQEVYGSHKWASLRKLHFQAAGDMVDLCRKTRCPYLYVNGSYLWWA